MYKIIVNVQVTQNPGIYVRLVLVKTVFHQQSNRK